MSEAQGYANQGYFTVAGWIDTTGASGHVVVIVPGEESYSSLWGGMVPCTMDTGGGMKNAKQKFSQSFRSTLKGSVKLFIYK